MSWKSWADITWKIFDSAIFCASSYLNESMKSGRILKHIFYINVCITYLCIWTENRNRMQIIVHCCCSFILSYIQKGSVNILNDLKMEFLSIFLSLLRFGIVHSLFKYLSSDFHFHTNNFILAIQFCCQSILALFSPLKNTIMW